MSWLLQCCKGFKWIHVQGWECASVSSSHIYGTRLTLYSYASLDAKVIMSKVLSSLTCIRVLELLWLVEWDRQLFVEGRYKWVWDSDKTVKTINPVHEDVSQILNNLRTNRIHSHPVRHSLGGTNSAKKEEGECTDCIGDQTSPPSSTMEKCSLRLSLNHPTEKWPDSGGLGRPGVRLEKCRPLIRQSGFQTFCHSTNLNTYVVRALMLRTFELRNLLITANDS